MTTPTTTTTVKSSEITAIRNWLGQATTGHGFALAAGSIAAAATGTVTWQQALIGLLGAAIAIIWPENVPLQKAATTLANDAVSLSPDVNAVATAYMTGVAHGNAAATPPVPVATPVATEEKK